MVRGFAEARRSQAPSRSSTSAPGIHCVAKPALESRENPVYSAGSVERLVIQNRDLLGAVKKPENAGGFHPAQAENEAWDSGVPRLLNLGDPLENGPSQIKY